MKQTKFWMLAAILVICGAMNMQAQTLRGTVTAYAGVSGQSDGNGISVYGNAPHTMQYRLEGVNILMTETPYAERYDFALQKLRYDKSGISLPNLYYRLDF